jgi:hypothetical protein
MLQGLGRQRLSSLLSRGCLRASGGTAEDMQFFSAYFSFKNLNLEGDVGFRVFLRLLWIPVHRLRQLHISVTGGVRHALYLEGAFAR